jgi:hypothetical protein
MNSFWFQSHYTRRIKLRYTMVMRLDKTAGMDGMGDKLVASAGNQPSTWITSP